MEEYGLLEKLSMPPQKKLQRGVPFLVQRGTVTPSDFAEIFVRGLSPRGLRNSRETRCSWGSLSALFSAGRDREADDVVVVPCDSVSLEVFETQVRRGERVLLGYRFVDTDYVRRLDEAGRAC